jgi:hypothetical protein
MSSIINVKHAHVALFREILCSGTSFIQQTLIERLLYARLCSRSWGYIYKEDQAPTLNSAIEVKKITI